MMYLNWHWVKKSLQGQLYIYKNLQEDLQMNEWMFMFPMIQRIQMVTLMQFQETDQGGQIFRQM